MKWRIKLIAMLCLLLSFDALFKYATVLFIPPLNDGFYPYGGIGIFKDLLGIELSIVHVGNKGTAWGLFSAFHPYLVGFRILAILGLICYLLFFNRIAARKIPLVFVISGALGNVIDCFVYGHVIDMIHFNFWGYIFPVFNPADAFIFIGACLLFLQASRKKHYVT